jgi:hypothetical protein
MEPGPTKRSHEAGPAKTLSDLTDDDIPTATAIGVFERHRPGLGTSRVSPPRLRSMLPVGHVVTPSW